MWGVERGVAGEVVFASGVCAKAPKVQICPRTCVHNYRSKPTKPSHPSIKVLNCSVILILPALPTCLLLEFDVFRPGKVTT